MKLKQLTTVLAVAWIIISMHGCVTKADYQEGQLIAAAMIDGKCGFVNTEGDFVIEPTYSEALNFSNGLACVIVGGDRFSNGDRDVEGGVCTFINTKNEVVFELEDFDGTTFFIGQRALIKQGMSVAFINKKGEIVSDGYWTLRAFSEEVATATDLEGGKLKVGFVDTVGQWKNVFNSEITLGSYIEGLAYYKQDKKYGYIDKNGNIVIPAQYFEARSFSEGLAAVKPNRWGGFGYINNKGEIVIPPGFGSPRPFNEGFAAVSKKGIWGFIDKEGNLLTEFKYDNAGSFNDGLAWVQLNDTLSYINTSGEKAFDLDPDITWLSSFTNGYATIYKNGKYGAINTKGEIVIKPKFDRLREFVFVKEDNITY